MSTLTVAAPTAPQQPGGLTSTATASQVVVSSKQPTANDSVSISQTASALSTSAAPPDPTSASNAVQAFEAAEAPPPYTLQDFQPNPNRDNARAAAPSGFSAFQGRQFSDLLKTLRSITSAVLPNFSYSA